LAPSGDSWTENVLLNFSLNCLDCRPGPPPGALVQDSAGNLYGISNYVECFQNYYGQWCDRLSAIFMGSLSNGNWQFGTLFDTGWNPPQNCCADLFYDLAIDPSGGVYATELWEEYNPPYCSGSGTCYWGSILKVPGQEELVGFAGPNFSNLTVDAHGTLYGTTGRCGEYNLGTVWQLTPQLKF